MKFSCVGFICRYVKVSNLGHPRRCANSNPPTFAVIASAMQLSEPLHEQSHAVCTASTLLLSLPACSLSCLAPYHHTAAVRAYVKVSSGILAQQTGAWACPRSISARYFCSLQQGESSSSERAEVACALAGAAARSALVRALSARIMRISLPL